MNADKRRCFILLFLTEKIMICEESKQRKQRKQR